MGADVAGDTLPGDAPNSRTNFLDSRHQWEGEQHDPSHAVAELCTCLRIGGDTARIIIGGTGDPAGAYVARQPLFARGEAPPMVGDPRSDRVSRRIGSGIEFRARHAMLADRFD